MFTLVCVCECVRIDILHAYIFNRYNYSLDAKQNPIPKNKCLRLKDCGFRAKNKEIDFNT